MKIITSNEFDDVEFYIDECQLDQIPKREEYKPFLFQEAQRVKYPSKETTDQ